MEEEEYGKARAEVQRKGIEVEGVMVEGISVGGHETCVVVPSINVAFDIGRCPQRAVHQDFLFITHAHLDHISVRRRSSPEAASARDQASVVGEYCFSLDVPRVLLRRAAEVAAAVLHEQLAVHAVFLLQ
ncbi:hypothetical protein EJ110_NYTH40858 [Nymphaea thermarum]|nr:hypothetical protein EJ110_NYTH40858 [Nymphaea thermarum]